VPVLAPYATAVAIFVVVGAITYFSLIIGELVPKRVALSNPEGRAMLIAKPMTGLARFAAPFVWFLTISTNLVLKVFGLGKEVDAPPSEEEVTHMIEQGMTAGVFHKSERAMVEGVLRLDERPVTEIMTRRTKIVWLNAADSDEVNWRKIVASGHSQFPVYEGTRDQVSGMVTVKALWANAAAGVPNSIRNHLIAPLFVPTTINVVQLLESFKKTGKHLALVTDEFGSVQGLVTLIDVMEAIVGDLPEPGDRRQPEAIQREDGSWLVDGGMPVDEFRRRFALPPLPGEEDEDFETLGGFIVDRLGHIPKAGEHFQWSGWRFEVVDMDRHRVDKVLFGKPINPPAAKV
jgi:putative hemolysin